MVDIDKAVTARLRTHGLVFEILVDCESALSYKDGKGPAIDEVLAVQKVFTDAKKALVASESDLKKVFGTTDHVAAAGQILKKGEIQVTADHRVKATEQKRRQLIEMVRRNGIDPRTKSPHPAARIELAFQEAKVYIDEHQSAESQVERVLKELRPILPIHFEKVQAGVRIPAQYTGKAYSTVAALGKMLRDDWLDDGSWSTVIEIPAGMQADLFDAVSKLTHGSAEIKIMKTGEK